MNGNSYDRARVLALENRAFRAEIPNLDDVRDAFVADEIDGAELDTLTEAAVFGRRVELPQALAARAYARKQNQVRFSAVNAVVKGAYSRGYGRSARTLADVARVESGCRLSDRPGEVRFYHPPA